MKEGTHVHGYDPFGGGDPLFYQHVTLPILVFGEGTGILAVNPLPLMVSTGVLGFVSSEPFTGIGSDYLFDAL